MLLAYSAMTRLHIAAIGSGRVLGFRLMENFDKPYHTVWSRWHISLSTWFRDYVYIPMGSSLFGERRHFPSLLDRIARKGTRRAPA